MRVTNLIVETTIMKQAIRYWRKIRLWNRSYELWPLDYLIEDILIEKSTEIKRKIWGNVVEHFKTDVFRAAYDYASRNPVKADTLVSKIFDAIIPRLETFKPSFFTLELIEEMEQQLDYNAVDKVKVFLCMRQFLNYLPAQAAHDAGLVLNHVFDWNQIAEKLRIEPTEAKIRSEKACNELCLYLCSEFTDKELQERTGGIVNYAELRKWEAI